MLFFFIGLYGAGVVLRFFEESISPSVHHVLPGVFAGIGLVMVLKAFTERKNVLLSWGLVPMNHFWIALAVSFNEHFTSDHTVLYLSGIVVFGLVGFACLLWLKSIEREIDLDRFHGHSHVYPGMAVVFLLACLSVAGFPITPTFVGEDLIFTHVHENQVILATFTALSFIIDGLAIIRIYARVFLGPHVKSALEMAYRSS